MQDAVHDEIPADRRTLFHTCAVTYLAERGGSPERIAAHLLRIPPAGDPATVAALRRAASIATARGAPEAALAYLRRALQEPPEPRERPEILTEAGFTATHVDLPAAALEAT